MWKSTISVSLVVGLAACSGSAASKSADSTKAVAASVISHSLARGTSFAATIESALSSRVNKPGETVQARVSRDVANAQGRVIIPSGSTVTLVIDRLEAASDQGKHEGELRLDVRSITVKGVTTAVNGGVGPVPHALKGRGITSAEAARIAVGTAVGAGIGQLIGKNRKSTIIGGAVGTVAGGAVAVRYAHRDIIVSAGAPVMITLSSPLHVASR